MNIKNLGSKVYIRQVSITKVMGKSSSVSKPHAQIAVHIMQLPGRTAAKTWHHQFYGNTVFINLLS